MLALTILVLRLFVIIDAQPVTYYNNSDTVLPPVAGKTGLTCMYGLREIARSTQYLEPDFLRTMEVLPCNQMQPSSCLFRFIWLSNEKISMILDCIEASKCLQETTTNAQAGGGYQVMCCDTDMCNRNLMMNLNFSSLPSVVKDISSTTPINPIPSFHSCGKSIDTITSRYTTLDRSLISTQYCNRSDDVCEFYASRFLNNYRSSLSCKPVSECKNQTSSTSRTYCCSNKDCNIDLLMNQDWLTGSQKGESRPNEVLWALDNNDASSTYESSQSIMLISITMVFIYNRFLTW